MHAVVKESSSTTKLRVVFDASATSSSGHSLSDTLLVVPTLYHNLTDILLQFRSYPVAISADISKMYRAVELSPPDRDLHRFVWRPDQKSELQDYCMTRVTFRIAASPYAAVQALQQSASDFGKDYPLAKDHVANLFYVDDCLAGADTPQEAVELQQQLRELLLQGGFDLRKWRSSSSTVMQAIPTNFHKPSQQKTLTEESNTQPQKALGIHWDATSDNMFIYVGSLNQQTSTKRAIVSDIARTFDILGWLSPSTI